MQSVTRESLIYIFLIIVIAAVVAWAGGVGTKVLGAWSLFAWCVALSFVINWLVFIPSFVFQTEHYFDATGTITYLSLTGVAVGMGSGHWRAQLLAFLVVLWAIRLGTFLARRIQGTGRDARFDDLKPNFARYLMVWTLQALWVVLTLGAALAAMTAPEAGPVGWLTLIGLALFCVGFAIEVEADSQKSDFNADPDNEGRFINVGLWAWCQHPNYLGEILLWFGVALLAWPALVGWQQLLLISPFFVFVLLTQISGIPLMKARGKQKFGHDEEYKKYRESTPLLFPRPPRTASDGTSSVID